MELNFKGKTALVTGGSAGIGRETVIAFAKSGANVVFSYLTGQADAESLQKELEEAVGSDGVKVLAVRADATKREDVKALVDAARGVTGTIDVLVNNAGSLVKREPISSMSSELWNDIIELNLTSVMLCTQEALPYIPEEGKIVNVSSLAAQNGGGPGASAYATAKGGVISLTKAMAKEFAPRRITVNSVTPGLITTRFHDRFTAPDARQAMIDGIPLGREGRPDEVAALIVFLASDWAAYITGETIAINGGSYLP